MAIRSPNAPAYSVANRAVMYRWDGLLNGDTGDAIQLDDMWLGSLQIIGTIGAGFNLNVQGSNEVIPVNWVNITSISTLTTLGLVFPTVDCHVRNYRPVVTAGDGTTNVSVLVSAMRHG